MAKMLLTQSQVSVLISSVIIFFFTVALFLSGYVLQQRTLNDLRDAIAPAAAAFNQPLALQTDSEADASNSRPSISNEVLLDLNHDAGSRADVIVDPPVAPHIDSSEVPTGHDGNNREAGSSGENVLKNTNHGLGSSSDIMEAFYDIDANRQATHEKLPYLTAPLSDPASSTEDSESANSVNGERAHYRDMMSSSWRKFRDASAKWSNRQIQRWIRRVRGEQIEEWEEGVDEDTPLEELSGAARRRRIKLDIRRLGVVEDGELRSVYRPRKRMG